ncbi:MAG: DUF4377 domain-containing protein [Muribaculaceae bacterium]|nr:DUF4377 domain-containing protein [Muribaculaceae bacterium]
MKNFLIPFLVIACLFMTACSNEDEPKDNTSTILLSVDSHTDDMIYLGGNGECMLIKEEDSNEWEHIDGIIGFNYEKGYKYLLKVEKTILANPPQDSPNVEYRLIEIMSKKFDGFNISIQYAIDADDVYAVESCISSDVDALSHSFYLLYYGKISGKDVNIIELIDNEGNSRYKYGIERQPIEKIEAKYACILPQGQIVSAGTWILHETINDAGVDDFFVILEKVSGLPVRSDQPLYVRPWLYKDNTEYYQKLCPNAGVRSVIIVQTLCTGEYIE